MKLKTLFLSFFILMFNSSCITGLDYDYKYESIYVSLDKIKDKIKFTTPKEIKDTGKIYTYKNYLFISAENMGVHIIDNTDNKKPINKGFLQIPLNQDISIKGDILYADSLNEIVSIDISNFDKISVLKRIKLDDNYKSGKFKLDKDKGLEVGINRVPQYKAKTFSPITARALSYDSSSYFTPTGKSGSLSRFSIVNDYLYTVSNSDINVFDLKDSKNPEKIGKVEIDSSRKDIETIYSYKDKLFMGSATGAYIYDNQNPQKPSFISKIEHIRSCDPIVVENDTAYITLRGGNTCGSSNNELDTIDISNIKLPKILKTYPLSNPWGLAIKDKILFVCDYKSGVKIFDAKDPNNLIEIKTINIEKPKDIIINENNLGIIVSDNGIYEYDFSNVLQKTSFEQLSYIKAQSNSNENNQTINGYYDWYKKYLEN